MPTPNSLGGIVGAIVVAETTVLAAAALSSPKEKHEEEQRGDGDHGDGTPTADSPSLDLQGASSCCTDMHSQNLEDISLHIEFSRLLLCSANGDVDDEGASTVGDAEGDGDEKDCGGGDESSCDGGSSGSSGSNCSYSSCSFCQQHRSAFQISLIY